MFVICRHGQTDGNLGKLDCYKDDTPLNIIGTLEALETGKFLQHNIEKSIIPEFRRQFDYVICSPYRRTVLTAQYILESIKPINSEIIYDERITEARMTCQTEKKLMSSLNELKKIEDKIKKKYDMFDQIKLLEKTHEEYFENIKDKTDESFGDFMKRLYDFIDDITEKYAKKGKKILIVTHGGVIKPMLSIMWNTGIDYRYSNWPFGYKNLSAEQYGKGNCILSMMTYSEYSSICKSIKLPKPQFSMIMAYSNAHLKLLYDNLKPIIIIFSSLNKKSKNAVEIVNQLFEKYGDVYVNDLEYSVSLSGSNNTVINEETLDYENVSKKINNNINNKLYVPSLRKVVCIGIYEGCEYAAYYAYKYKADGIFMFLQDFDISEGHDSNTVEYVILKYLSENKPKINTSKNILTHAYINCMTKKEKIIEYQKLYKILYPVFCNESCDLFKNVSQIYNVNIEKQMKEISEMIS